MYGSSGYGVLPYGASGGVVPFDFDAMLASSRDELVYTVELTAWQTGGEVLIDRTLGTNIGNMTLNGGLAAAFDGTTNQTAASVARTSGTSTGYVGKTLATPAPVERAVVHGSNSNGYAFTVNSATTVTLYGKQGAAPSSGTDGQVLGTISFTDTSNESTGRTITSTDAETVWDHVWVYVDCPTEPTAVYVGELVLYRGRAATIRLASAEWATAPTDVPASQPFDGRLTTVLQFSRSIVGERVGTEFQSGEGTIAFANPDGEYDDIVDGYSIDGRSVMVRVGRKTDAFVNHLTIFKGVGVDWSADNDLVTVTVRDKSFLLDVPAQPNVYAGTGGEEGGTDLTGKRKPILFGTCRGLEAILVNTTNLIYQTDDPDAPGGDASVENLFDRGVTLTGIPDVADYTALVAAAVAAGQFGRSLDGYIKLGAAASGVIQANVRKNPSGDANGYFSSDLVYEIVLHATDLSEDEIDSGTFDALAAASTAFTDYVGVFFDFTNSSTAREAITNVMAGVGGWAGFNRSGQLGVGILTAPSGSPVASFKRSEGDIIDLNREKLPSGVWPPPWRLRVAYQRAWTVFTDFAGAVAVGTKADFSQPYRLAEASDAGVLTDHPSAQDSAPIEAYFQIEAGAQAEADRLLALYTSGYRLYRMTVGRRGLRLNLGDVISVTWPRFGLDAGKLLRVVGVEDRIDISDGSGVDAVEIIGFG